MNLTVARFNHLLERLVDVREVYEPGNQADQTQRLRDRLMEAGDPAAWAVYE